MDTTHPLTTRPIDTLPLYSAETARKPSLRMSELDQYDYQLPRELIAQHPLPSRSDARLMVVRRDDESISHAYVRDLPEMLPRGDCLVFNDTKVIPARLVGRRQRTGARWSGLFLAADEHGVWQVLSKTRGKLEPGEAIEV